MISEGFVTNGAKVYICSRDAKACDKAAAELTTLGTKTPLPDLCMIMTWLDRRFRQPFL